MLSQQEMSDRFEIQELIGEYCHAIDLKDWDALDNIFTSDAEIDYTALGGGKGDLAYIKSYLPRAMERFPITQHVASNVKLTFDGDRARGRTMLFNPLVVEKDGERHVFFCGAAYNDEFVRTEKGWRITRRVESDGFFHNLPAWFTAAET